MFGYILANQAYLDDEQLGRYKGHYCGLCHVLGERHGQMSKLTLTYDMTFLILILSSMYDEQETEIKSSRCIVHPVHKHEYRENEFTAYAADMNIALMYLKLMDDWHDEKNLKSRIEAEVFRNAYKRICEKYSQKCELIEENLGYLSALEAENSMDVDGAAGYFGNIMAEIFDYKYDTIWSRHLHGFGESLGKFIYLMDAVCDIEADRKTGSYNPLLNLNPEKNAEDYEGVLNMLMADCAEKFEYLPLVRDFDIMKNIIYSGVWTKYRELVKDKSRDDEEKMTSD